MAPEPRRTRRRWLSNGRGTFGILVLGLLITAHHAEAQNAGGPQATAANQGHEGEYTREQIEAGARLFGVHCTACHGPNGDSVSGVALASGKFRHASSDEDLVRVLTGGIEGTAMRPLRLDRTEQLAVVAYLRTMRDASGGPIIGGDRKRGQAVLETKGQCLSCHRVNGKGGRVGPDLSGIGALRPAAFLQQTLLNPDQALSPANRSILAVKKDGTRVTGLRLNEDTHSVQLIDDRERLVSLQKKDLREYQVLTTSRMASYREVLTTTEIADLVTYLLSLRTP